VLADSPAPVTRQHESSPIQRRDTIALLPLRGQTEFQVKLETRSDPKAPRPQGPDPKAPDPRPRTPWVHIRTTNPIESVFSTVRLRHDKTKGNGSRSACLTMVFKLMETASKGWRSLNGKPLLAEVVKGTVFIDGIKEKPAA